MKPRAGSAHPLRLLDVHMARARKEIDLAAWVVENADGLRSGIAQYIREDDPRTRHRAEDLRRVLLDAGLEP